MEEEEKQIHPFLDKRIEDYCETYHSKEEQGLYDLRRQTYLHFVRPYMISGAWQGELLKFLVKIIQPKRVLEVGTFSGYSTLCFALASNDDCIIDTVEAMEEYKDFLIDMFSKNNVKNKINLHFGQGLDIIEKLDFKYDLVFIDAEKVHYPNYFSLLASKINVGGVILADNILWYGKVALENQKDKETLAIREFNEMVTKDDRFSNFILPIRDGIMVARKEKE